MAVNSQEQAIISRAQRDSRWQRIIDQWINGDLPLDVAEGMLNNILREFGAARLRAELDTRTDRASVVEPPQPPQPPQPPATPPPIVPLPGTGAREAPGGAAGTGGADLINLLSNLPTSRRGTIEGFEETEGGRRALFQRALSGGTFGEFSPETRGAFGRFFEPLQAAHQMAQVLGLMGGQRAGGFEQFIGGAPNLPTAESFRSFAGQAGRLFGPEPSGLSDFGLADWLSARGKAEEVAPSLALQALRSRLAPSFRNIAPSVIGDLISRRRAEDITAPLFPSLFGAGG